MDFSPKLGNIVDSIYKKFNYTLDAEVKDVLLDPAQHKLINAPAGGTKTTLTQLMVNLIKLQHLVDVTNHNRKAEKKDREVPFIQIDRILCLVYNRHNASDIDLVHARFSNALIEMKYTSPRSEHPNFVPPGVTSSTLHALSQRIIKDNLKHLKLTKFALASEENLNAQFRATVKKVMEESSVEVTNSIVQEAHTLYQLYVGLKLYETDDDTPLTDSIQFELALQGTNIPPKYLRKIFKGYDNRKKMLRIYDYSDMLRLCDQVLQVPEVREHYQDYYKIIVADEVQDFTPLMYSVFRSLIGPKTITISVGDPDQNIYSFLGAVKDAMANFPTLLGIYPKVFQLSVNRRCPKETMPYALNVISSIKTRGPREIKTLKPSGKLRRLVYDSLETQIEGIDRVLMEHPAGNMAILFRNKSQSILLSRRFFKQKRQVNYINAESFSEHRFYSMFVDSLREVFIYKSQDGLKQLFRFLPFNKKVLEDFFDFDPTTKNSKKCPNAILWPNLDFTPLYQNSKSYMSIHQAVEFVKAVASNIEDLPAADYIEQLADMFYNYYYAYIAETTEDEYAYYILMWLKEDLKQGYRLETTLANLFNQRQKLISKSRNVGKLNICTMHGTKGLEFDTVIINLEQDKPSNRQLSAEAADYQKDEETRLIYVAATRQKENLYVMVNMEKKHPLSDLEFFEVPEDMNPVIIQKNFNIEEKPIVIQEQVLTAPVEPRRRRRSALLDD